MTPRPDRIPLRPDPAAARSRGFNVAIKVIMAYLLRFQTLGVPAPLQEVLERHWGLDERREIILLMRAFDGARPKQDLAPLYLERATSSVASTASGGWAASLAQTASREFLMSLGPVSAGSELLRRCLSFESNTDAGIKVPAVVSSVNNAAFVKQGDPIAVEQFSLTSVTLALTSLATISTFSRETLRLSLPSLEVMVRTVLTEAIGLKLDSVMFSNAAAVADTSPAGLLLGLSGLTPSTDTLKSAALEQDVRDLVSATAPAAANAPVFLIAAPKQAAALKIYFGSDPPYEVFASSALSAGTVIAVASNCIASAIGPALDVDVSTQATLHMEQDSPAQLATGTGPTVATPIRSLYQTDTLAAKLRFDVSWGLRNSTGLSFMPAVNW